MKLLVSLILCNNVARMRYLVYIFFRGPCPQTPIEKRAAFASRPMVIKNPQALGPQYTETHLPNKHPAWVRA